MQIEDVKTLRDNRSKLNSRDRIFADSLLSQLDKKGMLSQKQAHWVGVLAQRALNDGKQEEPADLVKLGSFKRVIELFDTASQHLKFPKIRLMLHGGEQLALWVAGPHSKVPGAVNVSNGLAYGYNRWYGRVLPTGEWEPSKQVTPELMTSLVALLGALARDPAAVAAQYGKLTGRCCFCGSELTDVRSTEVGYGPVCAKRFGLAWGEKKEAA